MNPISRVNTLRGRLLIWLILPLLLLSLAHLSSIYINTKRTSTELFDRILVNLALSISEYALSSEGDLLTVDLLELINQTTRDKLYYKVLGPNGSFVVGYSDMPEPPGGLKQIHNHVELYDAVYLNEPVRIIAVSMLSERAQFSGWTKAFVAQTLRDRNQYVMDTMVDNLARLTFLILIIAALLTMGVAVALKPLKQLLQSLQYRDIHDLTPITVDNPPTEIASVAHSINELLARLANQIGLTKRFLENASHQLLTPITALALQCDMAMRRAETESGRESIAKIKGNADRISRLAHQLLQLSYSETVAFDDNKNEHIDLAEIAAYCVNDFLDQYDTEEIALNLKPAPIVGNETLLTEILNNLLENARKYGGIENTIMVTTYTGNGRSVLEVTDQGPGIVPELRQLVTERFFRASNDESGSGLGLAIVKEIVLIHHGKMEIQSGDNDKGTTIRCTFLTSNRKDSTGNS